MHQSHHADERHRLFELAAAPWGRCICHQHAPTQTDKLPRQSDQCWGSFKTHQTQVFLNDIRGRRGTSGLHKLPFITRRSISACQPVAPGNLLHVPFGGWEVTAWSNSHWSQWRSFLVPCQSQEPILVRTGFKPFILVLEKFNHLQFSLQCSKILLTRRFITNVP